MASFSPTNKSVNVLLIGNNPVEVGSIYSLLKKIKKKRFITYTAFDFKNIFTRILKFKPNFILIDDAFAKAKIKKLIARLSRNRKTKDIPVAILKSSNYYESLNEGVSEFISKENLTSDYLYHSILNSTKFKRTYAYLYLSYKKRAGQLRRFFEVKRMGL